MKIKEGEKRECKHRGVPGEFNDPYVDELESKIARLGPEKAKLIEALEDLVSQVEHLEYPVSALDLDKARAILAWVKEGE